MAQQQSNKHIMAQQQFNKHIMAQPQYNEHTDADFCMGFRWGYDDGKNSRENDNIELTDNDAGVDKFTNGFHAGYNAGYAAGELDRNCADEKNNGGSHDEKNVDDEMKNGSYNENNNWNYGPGDACTGHYLVVLNAILKYGVMAEYEKECEDSLNAIVNNGVMAEYEKECEEVDNNGNYDDGNYNNNDNIVANNVNLAASVVHAPVVADNHPMFST